MSGEVSVKSGIVTMTLKDISTSESFTVTRKSTGMQLNSAEWVEEAPYSSSSYYTGTLPLANFGTATFTGCKATVKTSQTPDKFGASLDKITMINNNWQTLAQPSAIKNGAFSVGFVQPY
jgi:hypothetical protein